MADTPDTPPVLPPSPAPDRPPLWMPAGGRGALYFWGGLSLLLACGLVGAYQQAASSEKKSRQLSEQSVLLINERDKLRSQVDMLQTELSQQGVQLKNSEETLREAKQTLQSAQAQNDQQGQQAEAARRAESDLQALLQKAVPAADGLDILNGKAGDGVVTVRLSNTLLFDAGDVAPNAKGADVLKKLAAALKGAASVQEIAVGGHSDPAVAAAPGKPAPDVWDLSARRAAAVARALAEGGVAPMSLSAQGFGATRPAFPNDGPDKAKNRRVDIVIRLAAPSLQAAATSPN